MSLKAASAVATKPRIDLHLKRITSQNGSSAPQVSSSIVIVVLPKWHRSDVEPMAFHSNPHCQDPVQRLQRTERTRCRPRCSTTLRHELQMYKCDAISVAWLQVRRVQDNFAASSGDQQHGSE